MIGLIHENIMYSLSAAFVQLSLSSYLIISLMRDWVRSLAPSGPHLSSMSSMGIELKTMAVINLKINELNIQETAIITLENVSPK